MRAGLWLMVVLATVGAAATECCDPARHAVYLQGVEDAQLCRGKGGVPSTQPAIDEGGHVFAVLVSCGFPCDERIVGERGR